MTLRRVVVETSCPVCGAYEHTAKIVDDDHKFVTPMREVVSGVSSEAIEAAAAALGDSAMRQLAQQFNPPADMAINEKVAWREGVYYAIDFIMERVPSDVEAAIRAFIAVQYGIEEE